MLEVYVIIPEKYLPFVISYIVIQEKTKQKHITKFCYLVKQIFIFLNLVFAICSFLFSFCQTKPLELLNSSVKLKNLASGLSPAILRLGGTDADFLIFDNTARNMPGSPAETWYQYNKRDHRNNFTMSGLN